MKCKACNTEFTPHYRNKSTGEYEELCNYCLLSAKQSLYDMEDSDDPVEDILDLLEGEEV